MDDLKSMLICIANDDYEEITTAALNEFSQYFPNTDFEVFKERARIWNQQSGKFQQLGILTYAKIFWLITEKKQFLQQDYQKWQLSIPMQRNIFEELFLRMAKNNGMGKIMFLENQSTIIKEIYEELKKGKKLSENISFFVKSIMEPKKDEDPTPIKIQTDEDRFPDFPFLSTPKPPGLFCSFIHLFHLNDLMVIKCQGRQMTEINNMLVAAAWKEADRVYFLPWVRERLDLFQAEKEDKEKIEEEKISNNMIMEQIIQLKDIVSKKIPGFSESGPLSKILQGLYELFEMSSSGTANPYTMRKRVYIPEEQPSTSKKANNKNDMTAD